MTLPLKARMLQYAVQKNAEFCVDDIMTDLEPEYGGEKMFNKKLVTEYFDALLGVGFFNGTRMEFDENGELKVYCRVTEYGKKRAKFVPGTF